jgi:hypothetical protein
MYYLVGNFPIGILNGYYHESIFTFFSGFRTFDAAPKCWVSKFFTNCIAWEQVWLDVRLQRVRLCFSFYRDRVYSYSYSNYIFYLFIFSIHLSCHEKVPVTYSSGSFNSTEKNTGLSTVVICAGRSTYYLIYALQYMMLYPYQIIMAGMAGTIFLPETKDIPLSQGRQTIFILSNFYNWSFFNFVCIF